MASKPDEKKKFEVVAFETTMVNVQRMQCCGGETRCRRCGHPMTAWHAIHEGVISHCPACGNPLNPPINP